MRNAESHELPFLRTQRLEAYEEHAAKVPADHWKALKEAVSSNADEMPGAERIVAVLDGEIAGSVILFPAKSDAYEGFAKEQDYPEIRMLAVAPLARGKGAASALVKECISRAEQQGYSAIGLHTGAFMESAIQLYEKLGFIRVPELDFEPADDGILVKGFRYNIVHS
nr:GNAT family N-acetyltransferase [Peribacillus kribbensis]